MVASDARLLDDSQGQGDPSICRPSRLKEFLRCNQGDVRPPTKGTAPLLSSDGSMLLTEKSQILKCWASTSVMSSTAPPQSPTPPSIGSPKWKSTPTWTSCPVLNIAGKILSRILLNPLNGQLEQGLLPESQRDFQRHRGTTDMVLIARQLQEKCQEMRTHLYITFVDLTKAFDTVNCRGLWKIMQAFGCPERFTHMVRQLHDGMMMRVTEDGATSEAFAVTDGVKQGCVLTPITFSLMLSGVLMDACRDERPG
ncbi:hypothetical protein SprV_0301150600 [Sparganum proliferum]